MTLQPITIPVPYRPAFEAVARMDGKTVEGIRDAIAAVERCDRVEFRTQRAIVTAAPDVDADLLSALVSLGALRRNFVSGSDLATAIGSSKSLSLEDSERAVLSQRLDTLLALPGIETLTRANDLWIENQANWIDARIITDMRPIFLSDPPDDPVAAIISHVLKIEVLESQQSFFVALDDDDLRGLSHQVERALAKSEQLQAFLTGAGLPVVRLQPEKDEEE